MQKQLRCVLSLVATALFTQGAMAQTLPDNDSAAVPPIQTDRPTFTAAAALVPRRALQLEAGIKRTSTSSERKLEWGQLLFRYGANSSIELRLAVNSFSFIDQVNAQQEGFEDLKLSAKISLLGRANGVRPAITLLPGLQLPTGHSDITNDDTLPSLMLLFDWNLGGPFSLSGNLGWERTRFGEEPFSKFSASLSLGFKLTHQLSGFVETYGFDREMPAGDSVTLVDTGLIYLLKNSLSIDVTLGSGLSGTETDYFFGIGFGKRW